MTTIGAEKNRLAASIDLKSIENKCDETTRAADMVVVRAIVECATMDGRDAAFGLDARASSTYTLRIRWTVAGAFTDADAQRLADASTRIVEVRYARRTVFVVFARVGKDAGARVQYEPPATATTTRKRAREIDWGPSVESDDDRARLDAIVDAVYMMRDTMPMLRMWSEPIVAGRTGIDDAHGVETLAEPVGAADASESEALAAAAPGAAIVGHALCFAGIDEVTGDFFAWLRRRFGPTVARACVFVPPAGADADTDAVLVVNVRAAHVDATRLGAEAAKTHTLRGDPLATTSRVRAKRARK